MEFAQFKPAFGDIAGNIQRMKFLIARVDAELIVLAELCNTGYLFTSRREAEELGEEIPTGRTSEALCGLARPK